MINRMHVRPNSLAFKSRGSRYSGHYESNVFTCRYVFSELIPKWSYASHNWVDETYSSYDWNSYRPLFISPVIAHGGSWLCSPRFLALIVSDSISFSIHRGSRNISMYLSCQGSCPIPFAGLGTMNIAITGSMTWRGNEIKAIDRIELSSNHYKWFVFPLN